MSFLSSVLLTNGILSLILALVTSAGCLIMGIAIVRNPLNAVEAARPMESHASVPWEETTLGPWGVASQPY